ncbi:PQQ-binding-like beta-propeller repeat protein [candidate division WOR-3 bacterium]|nr:PQQ-binding-like beta-propeller repeat protein [candidate division WOR-3 bacterium]
MRKLFILTTAGLLILALSCDTIEGTGYISISSTPEGAQIYIDDSLTGEKTNHVFAGIEQGDHTIRLEYYDWPEWTAIIEVEKGETTYVDAALRTDTSAVYIKWIYDLPGNSTYPAIGDDGTVYLGSIDGLYAITTSGMLRWLFTTEEEVHSDPTIGPDGTIYFGCDDNYLYALNPNGSLKWKFKAGAEVLSSPAIGVSGSLYFSSADSNLYALTPEGEAEWKRKLDLPVNSNPIIGLDGIIYLAHGHWLFAITPDNSVKWIYETPTGSEIYYPAIGQDGTIYFGCEDSYLYAVSNNGTLKWRCDLPGFPYGPSINSDGTLFVTTTVWDDCCETGYFYAIDPSGNIKCKLYEEYCAATRCFPVIGGNDLVYVLITKYEYGSYLASYTIKGTLVNKTKLVDGYASSSISISQDGTMYFSLGSNLFAIQTSSFGLASSPWPKYMHDNQNTGRWGW